MKLADRNALLFLGVVLLWPSVSANARHLVPQHLDTYTAETPFGVEEFVHRNNRPLFLREPIDENLSQDDLPYLYGLLGDTSCYLQWDNVLLALCVLEDGPAALEAVVDKACAPWDWSEHQISNRSSLELLKTRIRYLWCVSMIPPEISGPFLAPLLTPEGATAFLESWGALPLPTENPQERSSLIHDVQRAAAFALVYTRAPELLAHVEKAFAGQAKRTDGRGYWEGTRAVFALGEALALNDFLAVEGWEAGLKTFRFNEGPSWHGPTHRYFKQRIEAANTIAERQPGVRWKRVVVRHQGAWLTGAAAVCIGLTGIVAFVLLRRVRIQENA